MKNKNNLVRTPRPPEFEIVKTNPRSHSKLIYLVQIIL